MAHILSSHKNSGFVSSLLDAQANGGIVMAAVCGLGIVFARFFDMVAHSLGGRDGPGRQDCRKHDGVVGLLHWNTVVLLGCMIALQTYSVHVLLIARYPPEPPPFSLPFFFTGVLGAASTIAIARLGVFIALCTAALLLWVFIRQATCRQALWTCVSRAQAILNDHRNKSIWNRALLVCGAVSESHRFWLSCWHRCGCRAWPVCWRS